MVMFSYLIPLVSIMCGLVCFVKVHKHLLGSLLSLEFIMLNVFWFMVNCLCVKGGELYFCLFFLSLAACEGALGLGLIVLITRSHGSDDFKSLTVLQC